MAKYNKNDLRFVLDQIKIAEQNQHTGWNAGTNEGTGGLPLSALIDDPLLSLGLRTVDGTFNNLIPGQQNFGAADTLFPRLLTPDFRDDGDGDTMFLGPGAGTVTNTDYSTIGNTSLGGANPGVVAGDVADADPRIISNLVVDQSNSNPAAVAAFNARLGEGETPMTVQPKVIDGQLNPLWEENLFIKNVAPDEGLSASYNSWFTLFGQFFDHGLDLVTKGDNGTVYIPLQSDDPLVLGDDGIAGTTDDLPAHLRFMAVTRTTPFVGLGEDGVLGTSDDTTHEAENTTTSWVDQNQTYTSHPSHQAFLREYDLVGGSPVATGNLLEGANGGLATWADIKAQARTVLGIELSDFDIDNVPLLATDQYGKLILSAGGKAQLVTTGGLDEGDVNAPISTANAVGTNHAFLNDIAHHATPGKVDDHNPLTVDPDQTPDLDAGPEGLFGDDHNPTTYDNELLDAHYITGDGRGNENIGLTSVHHVFHSEHNRQVDEIKDTLIADAQELLAGGATQAEATAFLNEWLTLDIATVPANAAGLVWDGERIFQAARFANEMQYQHLVFEEFARKVQPAVNVFAGIETNEDAAIVAEFAHVVYRFGHSMLTETVDRIGLDGQPVGSEQIGLIEAFLNPLEYASRESAIDHGVAASEIIRGMTRQAGNELDEFVTGALRNNLVGLPLDLAAINIARGRETGVPSLNEARRQFFDITNDSRLEEYSSWADFSANLKNPESVINFIAAYGTHISVTSASTLEAKRAAATLLVVGNFDVDGDGDIEVAPVDRLNFLNSTGSWASGSNGVTTTGLDEVDFWIGGLAEKQLPFGGLLGSTFGFVFEKQLELLQNSDRMYYLARTAGLNFLTELEGNSFAELIMRNTSGLGHVGGDVFAKMDHILELNQSLQIGADPLSEVVRNNPATPGADSNYLKYTGGGHVVLGGTDNNDVLIAGIGDDTLWGDGGNDILEGGAGNDQLIGGDGDDIITDEFGDDNIKGGAGNDVINAGTGIDLIIAGDGNDFVNAGEDDKETFGGEGDDFILGGNGSNTVFADGGSDWIEGEDQADLLQGDNGDPFQVSAIDGNDVIIGGTGNDDYDMESGDDIAVSGDGTERYEGMLGFDWLTHKGDPNTAIDADMLFTGGVPDNVEALRDRMDFVEGMSGWDNNDILRGDNLGTVDLTATPVGAETNTADGTYNNALNSMEQISLISGLQGLLDGMLGDSDALTAGFQSQTSFSGGNILLGGGGSDTIEGRGGNDLIDGDKWLNVQISYVDANNVEHRIDSLSEISAQMFAGTIKPSQLKIVREILTATGGTDTVVYNDVATNYIINSVPLTDPQGAINPDLTRGTWTVVDNDPLTAGPGTDFFAPPSDEGTDTLRNVERLQFADGDDIDVLPDIVFLTNVANVAATGQILISDSSPDEDQLLTATPDNLFDANGMINMASLQYHWEAQTAPGVWTRLLTNSPTFTPTNAQSGLALRVVATFEDNFGNQETIISATTAPVTNNNDTPAGTDKEVVTNEDTPVTLTTANFGFDDPDVGDNLLDVRIDSLPLIGSLTFNNGTTIVNVNSGDIISASDIGLGRLVYTPVGNGNGEPYAQFDFSVRDNAAATLGGIPAFDTTPNTLFLNVIPVNDAPTGADNTVTILEDGSHTFNAAEFGFTDLDGDVMRAVRIDSLPSGGTFTLSNVAVTAGQVILVNQIGNLKYTPAPDANGFGFVGNTYSSFTFSVQDVSIPTIPDSSFDATPNTMTIAVTPVNDAPVGIPVLSEDSPITNAPFITPTEGQLVSSSMLGVSDVDGLGALSYQWQEFNTATSTWVNITGGLAQQANFAPTQSQVGKSIRVSVSYLDGDGTTETVISAGTEVVGDLYNGNNLANNPALTNGEDIANGNGGADILRGLGGIDILNGGAGNDNIDGGDDNDTLDGGLGNDILIGGAGNDTLIGGTNGGADTLVGGIGADNMTGGDGNDIYEVDDLGDTVTETNAVLTQIDTVETTLTSYTLSANVENLNFTDVDPIAFTGIGNSLVNRIEGGDGDDVLDGGTLNDTLIGGLGNDTYHVDVANDVTTEVAGQGTDRVISRSLNYTLGVNVENLILALGAGAINGTGNTIANVITGNEAINVLSGGTGAVIDTISAGAGNDIINYIMGQGADVVDGGDDTDTLNITGVVGNDTLDVIFNGTALTSIEGGVVSNLELVTGNFTQGGVDTLTYAGTTAAITADLVAGTASGFSSITGIEVITAGSGNDTLSGNGNTLNGGAGDDSLTGGALNDILNGGDNNDTLTGNDGIDTLNGGAGDDVIVGGLGNDTIIGGAGTNDTVSYANETDVMVVDIALGTARRNGVLEDALSQLENIITGSGNDTLTSNGNNNTLDGGSGNDLLQSGGGIDRLIGGLGVDTLNSGTGNDFHVYNSALFGDDLVELFDANAAGGQDILDFRGSGLTAADIGGRIVISNGANSVVTVDGTETITLVGVNGVGTNAIEVTDFLF